MRRFFMPFVALVPALGLAFTASAAGASTHAPARESVSARAAAAAGAELEHLAIGGIGPNHRAPGHHAHWIRGLRQFGSTNWSGYADDNSKGNAYQKASGTWVQPAIKCPTKEDQIAVFWVGLDGFSTGTVEQGGTLAQCFLGVAHYYTWWEMYPTNAVQVMGSTVVPGDKISASVVFTSPNYHIVVTDGTRAGNNVNVARACGAGLTCSNASAQWIAEAPGGLRGEYPLPNFGIWTLTAASATSGAKTGSISAFPDDEITMFDGTGTYALAQPGGLFSGGTTFVDAWKNSY